MTFQKYQLSKEIYQGLEAMGYEEETLVQELSIQHILDGDDVLIQSQTGSGKTAAFGIPLMEGVDWDTREPQVVVIVPTRELAIQVQETLFNIARYKRLNVLALYGKTSFDNQARDLRGRVHVVVATPGRLLDHMRQKTIDLSHVKALVMDEVDELLNMGFYEDSLEIAQNLSHRDQTVLMSATVSDDVKEIAEEIIPGYEMIKPEYQETVLSRLERYVIHCDTSSKQEQLYNFIVSHEIGSAIVFFNQKIDVDAAYEALKRYLPIERMHGNLQQKHRTQIISDFKAGKFRFLFASDVAARGLDIESVALIVNFDVPHSREIYQHRIGRSARLDQEGMSLTLVSEQEYARWLDIDDSDVTQLEWIPEPSHAQVREFESWVHKNRDLEVQEHEDITKLHIKGGKQQKIRPGDIVGAITAIKDVSFEDIGVISVLDESTYVDILNSKGKLVTKALQKQAIKGKVRRVEIAHEQ